MFQQIGMLLFSLMITNWIYSEVVLFFPSVAPMTERVFEVARIPTHNEWPEIQNSQEAKELKEDLNGILDISSITELKTDIRVKNKTQEIKAISNQSEKPYVGLFVKTVEQTDYISGESIFTKPGSLILMLFGYIPFV